jgi:hypothetical protein
MLIRRAEVHRLGRGRKPEMVCQATAKIAASGKFIRLLRKWHGKIRGDLGYGVYPTKGSLVISIWVDSPSNKGRQSG